MQSSDEWTTPVEYYQSITPDIAFDELFDEVDANSSSVKTATLQDDSKLVSPTTSLSPNKGNVGKSRRSRASKKAPTTLLNASPNNFRALVQQFTGCHSAPQSFKGPINLNFEQYRGTRPADQIQQRHPLQSSDQPHQPDEPSATGSSTSDQSLFPFNNNSDFELDWQELSGHYSGGTPS